MTAETFSDVLGLLSGIALFLTAWRNDGLSAFVTGLRRSIGEAKKTPGGADKKADAVVTALEKDLTTWSTFDRWALRAGALLLGASFLVKVGPKFLAWLGLS
jgi:hypothetical protein